MVMILYFFVLGLAIGSFLNVVILRFHKGEHCWGRSKCVHCQKNLGAHELIPVLSYLYLKGKCKNCKATISIQYPLVELVTGVIFASLFYKFAYLYYIDITSFIMSFTFYATMFSLLIILTVYDLRHKIIPDFFVFPYIGLSFIGLFLFEHYRWYLHMPNWNFLLSGILLALPFALLWYFSKGAWMGFGDAKLALGIGWFLAPLSAVSAILLAFWTGSLIGIILLLFRKISGFKSEIPFAPFLILGVVFSFFFELNFFSYFLR